MKAEAWIFGLCTAFLMPATPAYWLVTAASEEGGDWTGTSALTMTTLLTLMVTLGLGNGADVALRDDVGLSWASGCPVCCAGEAATAHLDSY